MKKAMSTELLDETNLSAYPVSINQFSAASLAGLQSLTASIWGGGAAQVEEWSL